MNYRSDCITAFFLATLLATSTNSQAQSDEDEDEVSRTELIRKGFVEQCLEDDICRERNLYHLGQQQVEIPEYEEGTLVADEVRAVKSNLDVADPQE